MMEQEQSTGTDSRLPAQAVNESSQDEGATPEEEQEEDSSPASNDGRSSRQTVGTTARSSPQKTQVWTLPWLVVFVALYAFTLPWINFAIVQRYFINPKWGDALPGLGSTWMRKLTMRGHMACGAICLLLGPLQFIARVRRSYPRLHRWSGRIYCSCAMLSSLFGLIFIGLKKQLVGGWNMTVAFACAGLTIGVLAGKVWQTARAAKTMTTATATATTTSPRDFTAHRNWGIRSYSQILAPMLYRYWYTCVELFNIYHAPMPPRLGGVCRSDDICPDYLRFFDRMHCWTYWLTALGVAELIIYYLPKHAAVDDESIIRERSADILCETQRPLLSSSNDIIHTDNTTDGSPLSTIRDFDEDHVDIDDDNPHETIRSPSPTAVNSIGWILAVICVSITTRLFTYDSGEE
jgi:hypothetical protein